MNYYEELAQKSILSEQERKDEIARIIADIYARRKLLEIEARRKNMILLRSRIETAALALEAGIKEYNI